MGKNPKAGGVGRSWEDPNTGSVHVMWTPSVKSCAVYVPPRPGVQPVPIQERPVIEFPELPLWIPCPRGLFFVDGQGANKILRGVYDETEDALVVPVDEDFRPLYNQAFDMGSVPPDGKELFVYEDRPGVKALMAGINRVMCRTEHGDKLFPVNDTTPEKRKVWTASLTNLSYTPGGTLVNKALHEISQTTNIRNHLLAWRITINDVSDEQVPDAEGATNTPRLLDVLADVDIEPEVSELLEHFGDEDTGQMPSWPVELDYTYGDDDKVIVEDKGIHIRLPYELDEGLTSVFADIWDLWLWKHRGADAFRVNIQRGEQGDIEAKASFRPSTGRVIAYPEDGTLLEMYYTEGGTWPNERNIFQSINVAYGIRPSSGEVEQPFDMDSFTQTQFRHGAMMTYFLDEMLEPNSRSMKFLQQVVSMSTWFQYSPWRFSAKFLGRTGYALKEESVANIYTNYAAVAQQCDKVTVRPIVVPLYGEVETLSGRIVVFQGTCRFDGGGGYGGTIQGTFTFPDMEPIPFEVRVELPGVTLGGNTGRERTDNENIPFCKWEDVVSVVALGEAELGVCYTAPWVGYNYGGQQTYYFGLGNHPRYVGERVENVVQDLDWYDLEGGAWGITRQWVLDNQLISYICPDLFGFKWVVEENFDHYVLYIYGAQDVLPGPEDGYIYGPAQNLGEKVAVVKGEALNGRVHRMCPEAKQMLSTSNHGYLVYSTVRDSYYGVDPSTLPVDIAHNPVTGQTVYIYEDDINDKQVFMHSPVANKQVR